MGQRLDGDHWNPDAQDRKPEQCAGRLRRWVLAQFGYAFLSPANPTYYTLDFNFDTDLGMLSKSTPIVTYSISADIKRFVDYGHKIIWYHGLSDPGPPVLGTIKYYEEMAQQMGGLQQRAKLLALLSNP